MPPTPEHVRHPPLRVQGRAGRQSKMRPVQRSSHWSPQPGGRPPHDVSHFFFSCMMFEKTGFTPVVLRWPARPPGPREKAENVWPWQSSSQIKGSPAAETCPSSE